MDSEVDANLQAQADALVVHKAKLRTSPPLPECPRIALTLLAFFRLGGRVRSCPDGERGRAVHLVSLHDQ